MRITRRAFLSGAASTLALPYLGRGAFAAVPGRPLPIPPLIDAGGSPSEIVAREATTSFLDGVQTPTWGFSESFLGPVLRFRKGTTAAMRVANRLEYPITCHWHGLHVPAALDGGPQLAIKPGDDWQVELPVDQPAATLWYHSHAHGVTAEHVYFGLSGMIIVEDPSSPDSAALPTEYGIDDIPLVIQDRAFSSAGALSYFKGGPSLMHGFRADQILVNGAIRPIADVPSGLTRLRLLNGSNARIYHLRFSDDRTFHRIASDGGLLPAPVATKAITLAPAERIEVLVDFSDGQTVALVSGPDTNDPMGGGMMMGGMVAGDPPPSEFGRPDEFDVMQFRPDSARAAKVTAIPTAFSSAPRARSVDAATRRDFTLNMGMGGGMGMGGMGMMTINGEAYDPRRIDVPMRRGEPEIWRISAVEMAHPFHVHGTAFQVLTQNGVAVPFDATGLKDVLLVDGEAELLVQVDQEARTDVPFMFHCHILEHEDAGMMGQFTVT